MAMLIIPQIFNGFTNMLEQIKTIAMLVVAFYAWKFSCIVCRNVYFIYVWGITVVYGPDLFCAACVGVATILVMGLDLVR